VLRVDREMRPVLFDGADRKITSGVLLRRLGDFQPGHLRPEQFGRSLFHAVSHRSAVFLKVRPCCIYPGGLQVAEKLVFAPGCLEISR